MQGHGGAGHAKPKPKGADVPQSMEEFLRLLYKKRIDNGDLEEAEDIAKFYPGVQSVQQRPSVSVLSG
eukprot:285667-Lingulodinium_polyedra.AAC.1